VSSVQRQSGLVDVMSLFYKQIMQTCVHPLKEQLAV